MSEQALEIWEELEKTISLVTSARRMILTGSRVDLAALERKVTYVCSHAVALQHLESRTMVPVMEALIDDLDHLAQSVETNKSHVAERLSILTAG